MSIIKKTFDSYKIYYYGAPQYDWNVILQLYQNGKYVGRFTFMKEGIALPDNYANEGLPYVHFSYSEFENVINILRNEGPLYIKVNTTNGIGMLVTSEEELIGD